MSKLDDLYSQIPNFKCIEGCTDCCGPVVMNPEEAKRIGKKIGVNEHLKCEFSINDSCSIHENRPLLCRIFGAVQSPSLLDCPHGCGPMFPISKDQAEQIKKEYKKTKPVL